MAVSFTNPTYNDEGDRLDDNEESDNKKEKDDNYKAQSMYGDNQFSADEDFDFHDIIESADQLNFLEELRNLDISTLKAKKCVASNIETKWRRGPTPVGDNDDVFDTKIGSLEGSIGSKIEGNSNAIIQNLEVEIAKEDEPDITANNSLISYFAYLGTCDDDYEVDFQFINNLLKYADVNTRDGHGQSLLHEVAREWSTDFANFLKLKGININAQDKWGRTPLFVAAASNYVEMVEWLLQNGANINHRTIEGEGQSVVHFAAKYDAVEVFVILLKHGANPLERDFQMRTPFFVAAEAGQKHMCDHMLDLGLPVAAYDENAVSVIDNVISKMPTSIAYTALDQFVTTESLHRRKKYYLSCLEKRRYYLLERSKGHFKPPSGAPNVLEILVQRNDISLVTHPVIIKLIELKSIKFAKTLIRINVALSLLYTILWTSTILIPSKTETKWSTSNVAQLITATLAQFIATYQLYQIYQRYRATITKLFKERKRVILQCKQEERFCHPRWILEKQLLKKKKSVAKKTSVKFFSDGWNVVDLISLLMGTGAWIVTVMNIIFPNITNINSIWVGYCTFFILLVWLRLNRYVRHEHSLGGIIAMLEESLIGSAKFAFLFFEFFIPFVVAFWVLFGGVREGSNGGEYEKFNDLVYQLYLLAIVGDYDYDALKHNKIASQVLVGIYFILVSIISVNLLVALFTEAFIRISETAVANSRLREAEEIIDIERRFPEKQKNFEMYLNKNCAPLIARLSEEQQSNQQKEYSSRQALSSVYFKLRRFNPEMNNIIKEQELLKHGAETGGNALQDFHEKYLITKQNDMLNRLDQVATFQSNLFNKAQRKTRNALSRMVERTVLVLTDTNDGSVPTTK